MDQQLLRQLVRSIEALPPKHFNKVIGIDGLGASGKTTIAREIQKLHPKSSIVHTDEFYKPFAERNPAPLVNGATVSVDFDWDRFEDQVLKAVRRNLLVKYERYDWRADRWDNWVEIPPENWIIIVGVYALQSRFFTVYDYSIWCEVPKEIRLRRMVEREGEIVAHEWLEKWSGREENYLALEGPDKRAASTILANTSG
ncbi:MAG: hypothetical protein AAB420_04255 [Patescibacteria group bacterium]